MAIGDLSFAGNNGLDSSFLQPTQGKQLYGGNYIDFTNENHNQWAQQFLPDVYEKEIEIYGNRTISGFLRMVSAEMPSTSDQIIWLEQGRLHTRYQGLTRVTNLAGGAAVTAAVAAGGEMFFQLAADQNGPDLANEGNFSGTAEGDNIVNFRVGQTVMIQAERTDATGTGAGTFDLSKGVGPVIKGIVTGVGTNAQNTFSVRVYQAVAATTAVASTNTATGRGVTFTALAYGSEFGKGTGNFTEKLDPSYSSYQNSPIIMKEHYSINGSDTSQIGWIEVTSENGASGYLWYVKAEHENRLRWEDQLEMAMLEAVPYEGARDADGNQDYPELGADDFNGNLYNSRANTEEGNGAFNGRRLKGTQGFFDALETRGNQYTGLSGDLAFDSSTTGLQRLNNSFDVILKQMDKQGAIEENMLYVNRDLALAFDDFLATQNNYGGSNGVSWGVFNNSADMAIDLGFSGFRRGSYDFYKTDWKYLNDYSTRGGFGNIEGVLIPAGTSTVYDQNLGKNIKRPFLHVRYRASEADNRKMKSWITGSVGGAYTTDVDEMRMHYLTERCLITQGANNFFLLDN